MSFSVLFNRLPSYIQNVIKTYYLSYGTHTANILHRYLTTLPTNSNMTVWRHKMLRHFNIEIRCHCMSGFIAVFELNNAFLAGEPDSDSKRELYRNNNNLVILMFKAKMSTFAYPIIYGTPTAIVMRKCIPHFRQYDNPEQQNTIWRIKVRTSGGHLTYKKVNNLKSVCSPLVYNELIAAYKEY